MALVMVRGAIQGEQADAVAIESIAALLVFMVIGAGAGWVMDYLIRDSVEAHFRKRVDWYRKGLIDAGLLEEKPKK